MRWSGNDIYYHLNGQKYKNHAPFLDEDILVILEDDADIALKDHTRILIKALTDMRTELMYLGWCESKMARPAFLCSHAYAVTRAGITYKM